MAFKKIYDPLHGFIHCGALEAELIDTGVFQRLHYLHQLGIAYLVYPGATHTRFEHSLGVMAIATEIFDKLSSSAPRNEDLGYWRQIIRLAALCHDLGHLPFSHVAEHLLLGDKGHELWTIEIIRSSQLAALWKKVSQAYGREVIDDILKIAIGAPKLKELIPSISLSSWEKVVAQIVAGDFFGADRIDYLLRDARCTGVAYGLFDYHQLIEMLCLISTEERLELGIEENGLESCEALLLARHFMHRRVYQYPSIKAYSFHLSQFIQKIAPKNLCTHLQHYLAFTDNEVLATLNRAKEDPHHPGHREALCLTQRSLRFRALEIPERVGEIELSRLQQELSLNGAEIGWHLRAKQRYPLGLNVPVLKRNGDVVPSSSCSSITIPPGPAGWLYIAPAYEAQAAQYFSRMEKS